MSFESKQIFRIKSIVIILMLLNIFYTAGIFVLSIALALSQFVLNVLAFKQKKNAMGTFPVYYIYFF